MASIPQTIPAASTVVIPGTPAVPAVPAKAPVTADQLRPDEIVIKVPIDLSKPTVARATINQGALPVAPSTVFIVAAQHKIGDGNPPVNLNAEAANDPTIPVAMALVLSVFAGIGVRRGLAAAPVVPAHTHNWVSVLQQCTVCGEFEVPPPPSGNVTVK